MCVECATQGVQWSSKQITLTCYDMPAWKIRFTLFKGCTVEGLGKRAKGLGGTKVCFGDGTVFSIITMFVVLKTSANGRDCASRVEHFRHHAFARAVTGAVHNLPGATCT